MILLPDEINCGYWDSSEFSGLPVSPHRTVTRYEIELYLEDGKTTFADGNAYAIKKNYIQISRPGQVRHSVLPFKTLYLKFPVTGVLAQELDACPQYFQASHPDRLRNKFEEIIRLNECGRQLMLCSHLLALLDLIFFDAKIPSHRSGKNYETVSAAKKYIQTHFAEKITLSDMAKAVHLSDIYFHTVFTEATGISPHEYLIDCRLEHAKKMLWNTAVSISEVAEKSGFGAQQYLTRVFKNKTGLTPAMYRKNFQMNYLA